MDFLETRMDEWPNYWAFNKTLSAVTNFTSSIKREIDKCKYVTTIFLDLQKALETVDHKKTT